MTMLENEAGGRYQPCHGATFIDFGSDIAKHRYKHTVSIRNMRQHRHVSSGGFGYPALLR